MRELETGTAPGGGGSVGERRQPSTGTEEGDSSSESAEGSMEELDLLFEKEQGVVRRAGWLSFKPLITLHKDRKLELVTRRKWKQYWVTLKGELERGTNRGVIMCRCSCNCCSETPSASLKELEDLFKMVSTAVSLLSPPHRLLDLHMTPSDCAPLPPERFPNDCASEQIDVIPFL